ncbi:hypothetical protein BAV2351 [Bordetella avium 197N]|uniref:Uncharacterized protein n=1 Tax=Bordetella avium (strain 197N) TaxID=360910 RepID=Q2KY80_BORA1|nr:hypothetical protein BAV2351 [Bordetella avium 197N]
MPGLTGLLARSNLRQTKQVILSGLASSRRKSLKAPALQV